MASSRRLSSLAAQPSLPRALWLAAKPTPRLLAPLRLLSGGVPNQPPVQSAAEAEARDQHVERLQISAEWKQRLRELTRPAATSMVAKLDAKSPLCFRNQEALDKDPEGTGGAKGTTLVDEAQAWKEAHPDKLLLIRVGDFYEAFGVDAVMLVEHAGLNPMGQKCRAGCPVPNVQPTLTDLTAAGFTVAVYEETQWVKAFTREVVAPDGTTTIGTRVRGGKDGNGGKVVPEGLTPAQAEREGKVLSETVVDGTAQPVQRARHGTV